MLHLNFSYCPWCFTSILQLFGDSSFIITTYNAPVHLHYYPWCITSISLLLMMLHFNFTITHDASLQFSLLFGEISMLGTSFECSYIACWRLCCTSLPLALIWEFRTRLWKFWCGPFAARGLWPLGSRLFRCSSSHNTTKITLEHLSWIAYP